MDNNFMKCDMIANETTFHQTPYAVGSVVSTHYGNDFAVIYFKIPV